MLSVLVPVIAHGIYDFCAFYGSPLFVAFFFIFIILVDIYCIVKVREISSNSVRFKYRNKYCPYCGTAVNSKYCTGCGNKNE